MQAPDSSLQEPIGISVPDTSDTEPSTTPKKSSKKSKSKAIVVSDSLPSDVLDIKQLLVVLSEVRDGNFSVRLPVDKVGIDGKICDTLNEIITYNELLVQ